MARRAKILRYRRHAETFSWIMWVEANRLAHEAKRPHPKFADAALLEWSRALKRKDTAHRDIPERSQALVAFRLDVWERLGGRQAGEHQVFGGPERLSRFHSRLRFIGSIGRSGEIGFRDAP